jgi:hypothetical protein
MKIEKRKKKLMDNKFCFNPNDKKELKETYGIEKQTIIQFYKLKKHHEI